MRAINLRRILGRGLGVAAILAIVFVGGWNSAMRLQPPVAGANAFVVNPGKPDGIDLTQFWGVWNVVKEKSVYRPIDDQTLLYGAMKGIVSSLKDPYSVLLDPIESKRFSEDLSGHFDGIGAEIAIRKNQLVIVAPLEGSPAEKAGLLSGDAIISIDGVDTAELSLEEAVLKIRGPKGTVVKLFVFRGAFDKPKEIPVTRAQIVIKSVKWEWVKADRLPVALQKKKIALVKLSSFDEKVVEQFSEAVHRITVGGADGLIVDLRNNPGGLLDAAVSIGGEWIDHNLVVTESRGMDAQSEKYEYRSNNTPRLSGVPTVLLINQGSASASEILAGALQDYGKAVLIGTKTFGKGSVQELMQLPDGSALKLTIARWLTPHGRSINDNGIEPTIKIENAPDPSVKGYKDAQLERAFIEVLKKR